MVVSLASSSQQKLIKELPSLVPSDETAAAPKRVATRRSSSSSTDERRQQQRRGDETAEVNDVPSSAVVHPDGDEGATDIASTAAAGDGSEQPPEQQKEKEELGKNPGERAFFKLLHAEFKKTTHFFDKAQQEFAIREERVREGMEIMKQPNSIMVSEKWSLLAKSIFRLYKDLLLLETFAIMTYCSFSKILKKHDKVTGYHTRAAFMENVVNKANFTNYPFVLEMITRCERLYEDVSTRLEREGRSTLYEDERLFINMISRLNEQVLNTEDGEGPRTERTPSRPRPAAAVSAAAASKVDLTQSSGQHHDNAAAISTLRSLVQEHDDRAKAADVSEGCEGVDGAAGGCPDGRKRPPQADGQKMPTKRQKTKSED